MAPDEAPARAVILAGFVEVGDPAVGVADFATVAARLVQADRTLPAPIMARPPDVGIGIELPRPGPDTPAEEERRALEAAERLLTELASLTHANECVIVVEYDGEVVGWIEQGAIDEMLAVGLIGEWRRALDG